MKLVAQQRCWQSDRRVRPRCEPHHARARAHTRSVPCSKPAAAAARQRPRGDAARARAENDSLGT